MSPTHRKGGPRFAVGYQDVGPVTKGFCLAISVVSLVGMYSQRTLGVGAVELRYDLARVLDFEIWRLITYPFAVSTAIGLIIGVVVLWFFGAWFERQWGSRDFLRFIAVSCLGAGLVAIPISPVLDIIMPFQELGTAEGPGPAFDAMLIALVLTMPDSNILAGFVLPMRARTLVIILVVFQLVVGIQTGTAALSMTLGGMLMGYLLITGNWRPLRVLNFIRLWQMRRRRRGLYIVPPKKPKEDKTLH